MRAQPMMLLRAGTLATGVMFGAPAPLRGGAAAGPPPRPAARPRSGSGTLDPYLQRHPSYNFEIITPGYQPWVLALEVKEGVRYRLEPRLQLEPKPEGR